MSQLPFVDEHLVCIAAPRGEVWRALQEVTDSLVGPRRADPLRWFLGTHPPAGFEVAGRDPEERLVLTGRHRFSRYRLTFLLEETREGTAVLTARTHALFPGPHGRLYRTLVIGTGAHVLATRHLLRTVRRRATSPSASPTDPRRPGPTG